MTMPLSHLRACLVLVFAVGVAASAGAQSGLTGASAPPSGLSGTPAGGTGSASGARPGTAVPVTPTGAARPGAPVAGPGPETKVARTTAAPNSDFPGNPRLDASSRKLDRQIKRGICIGC